jgi:hypothetical protein
VARKRDDVDSACEEWAIAVRGYLNPRLAKDQLGPLRCTLGARRDLHHGGKSQTLEQHWPEYPFPGLAGTVNLVYRRLPESLQEILVAHYVAMTPRNRSIRADLMGLSARVYWDRVARAKATICGALLIDNVRTNSPN